MQHFTQMTPSIAKFVKEQREMFERYLKLPPSTPSRFVKLSNDKVANDNYDFQDAVRLYSRVCVCVCVFFFLV